jgi:hypothetical protein
MGLEGRGEQRLRGLEAPALGVILEQAALETLILMATQGLEVGAAQAKAPSHV